jgi:uncharacterized protein DUF72
MTENHKYAVEIRNKDWMVPQLADVVPEHGVALTLIHQGWMPRPWEMKDKFDLITVDFTYVRWLGDRNQRRSNFGPTIMRRPSAPPESASGPGSCWRERS